MREDLVFQAVDTVAEKESASTRRQMVAGLSVTLGGMGLLGLAPAASATHVRGHSSVNTPENIINIAATAEVLATIVNTVGAERVQLDDTTKRNVEAAAFQEKLHYEFLVSDGVGAKPATKRIWVPDSIFANAENLLTALAVGDQIFINAYLLGATVFARETPGSGGGSPVLARYAAEIACVESVHRALALQSLGKLGNDRAYAKFRQKEEADLPTKGRNGFSKITSAVKYLEEAGFGLGKEGATPGAFYEYDDISRRTPVVEGVNARSVN